MGHFYVPVEEKFLTTFSLLGLRNVCFIPIRLNILEIMLQGLVKLGTYHQIIVMLRMKT